MTRDGTPPNPPQIAFGVERTEPDEKAKAEFDNIVNRHLATASNVDLGFVERKATLEKLVALRQKVREERIKCRASVQAAKDIKDEKGSKGDYRARYIVQVSDAERAYAETIRRLKLLREAIDSVEKDVNDLDELMGISFEDEISNHVAQLNDSSLSGVKRAEHIEALRKIHKKLVIQRTEGRKHELKYFGPKSNAVTKTDRFKQMTKEWKAVRAALADVGLSEE